MHIIEPSTGHAMQECPLFVGVRLLTHPRQHIYEFTLHHQNNEEQASSVCSNTLGHVESNMEALSFINERFIAVSDVMRHMQSEFLRDNPQS